LSFPLCPRSYPPQSLAACLSIVAGRILSPGGANHARPFTARPSERRQSGRRKHARMATGSPSRRGTSACSASRDRPSPSPTLGDALNAGYVYLEIRCLGCDTNQTVARPPHDVEGALHAVQGLLAGSRLSVQAQPFGRAAADKDFGERSAVNVAAGGAVMGWGHTVRRAVWPLVR
jgi:hypothetical protein